MGKKHTRVETFDDGKVEDLQQIESLAPARQPTTKPFVDDHSTTGKDLEVTQAAIGIKSDMTKNPLYGYDPEKVVPQYASDNSTAFKSNRSFNAPSVGPYGSL